METEVCKDNHHRWQFVWQNDDLKIVQCERCQVYEVRPLRNGTKVLPLLLLYAAEDQQRTLRLSLHRLLFAGLRTDGAHHKQWYLHQLAQTLGYDVADMNAGIAP